MAALSTEAIRAVFQHWLNGNRIKYALEARLCERFGADVKASPFDFCDDRKRYVHPEVQVLFDAFRAGMRVQVRVSSEGQAPSIELESQ